MVERKQEPPWGGIKQLNFPLLSASPTTSLNGKGHRTLQQNISETRCTTALGHDTLPGHYLCRQAHEWVSRGCIGSRVGGRECSGCKRRRCGTPQQKQGRGGARDGGLSQVYRNGHVDWVLLKRQPLSDAQLHSTINANINRQYLNTRLSASPCSKPSACIHSLNPHNSSVQ